MKITCEHCGAMINTESDKKCPNCGAPYSRNKEYKELKELNKRKMEASVKSHELGNELFENTIDTFNKTRNVQKIVFIFALIIFICIAVFGLFMFTTNKNRVSNKIEERTNKNVIKEVSFNEMAYGEDFEIKCDEVKNYQYDELEKDRDSSIDYYNFHIVFKNNSDTFKLLSNINLTYTDDKGNEDVSARRHMSNMKEMSSALGLMVNENSTITGNVAFEIPKYVKDVSIKYENAIININDFKDKID